MDIELTKALQAQIGVERYNSAVYRKLAYVMDAMAWAGTAKWMHKSAEDEQGHANRIADFLIAMNVMPVVSELPDVKIGASSMLDAVRAVHALESTTTKKINDLYRLADDRDEPQACVMLHWFIDEQTRSMKETYDMVLEVQRAGTDIAALIDLDEKYGEG